MLWADPMPPCPSASARSPAASEAAWRLSTDRRQRSPDPLHLTDYGPLHHAGSRCPRAGLRRCVARVAIPEPVWTSSWAVSSSVVAAFLTGALLRRTGVASGQDGDSSLLLNLVVCMPALMLVQ